MADLIGRYQPFSNCLKAADSDLLLFPYTLIHYNIKKKIMRVNRLFEATAFSLCCKVKQLLKDKIFEISQMFCLQFRYLFLWVLRYKKKSTYSTNDIFYKFIGPFICYCNFILPDIANHICLPKKTQKKSIIGWMPLKLAWWMLNIQREILEGEFRGCH